MHTNHVFLGALFTVGTALGSWGCSGGGGVLGGVSVRVGPQDGGSEPKGDESTQELNGGSPEQSVVPPTAVGGAYLVCAADEMIPAREGRQAIGCALTKEEKKVSLSADMKPVFMVRNPAEVSYQYADAAPSSKWHWHLYVDAALDLSKVTIGVSIETPSGTISVGNQSELPPIVIPQATMLHSFETSFQGTTARETEYSNTTPMYFRLKDNVAASSDQEGQSITFAILVTFEISSKNALTKCVFSGTGPSLKFVSCSDGRAYANIFQADRVDLVVEAPNANIPFSVYLTADEFTADQLNK